MPAYDTAGVMSRIRVKRGARFATGDVVGTVNAFNHVHLNVGWPGEEYNPLRFGLVQFEDTVPPTIARGGVRLYDEPASRHAPRERAGSPFPDACRSSWMRGIRRTAIVRTAGSDSTRSAFRFSARTARPRQASRSRVTRSRSIAWDWIPRRARLVYAPGSGIPFYGRRATRFLYSVTNTFANGVATPGIWDPSSLPPGDYTLRVLAEDIQGNQALDGRDLLITIEPPAIEPR